MVTAEEIGGIPILGAIDEQERERLSQSTADIRLVQGGRPDVVIYPDSNKLGVGERLPRGGGLRAFFHREDAADYWEREQPHDV